MHKRILAYAYDSKRLCTRLKLHQKKRKRFYIRKRLLYVKNIK